MAHSEVSEDYSAPYQFFFYLYDKRNVSAVQHSAHSDNSSKMRIKECDTILILHVIILFTPLKFLHQLFTVSDYWCSNVHVL